MDREDLTREITLVRQRLETRKKPENHGKYSKDEIEELEKRFNDLLRQRDELPKKNVQPPRFGTHFDKKGVREDLIIAKELCYSDKVQEMIRKEPDPEKRMRILHDARVGILK